MAKQPAMFGFYGCRFLCLAMLIFALYTIKIYVHDVGANNNNKKHEHYNVRPLYQDGA